MDYIKGTIWVLLFGLLWWSCKKGEVVEKPLIQDEKMINILVDLHIAEAAILSANRAQKDSIGGVYYAQIFKMHNIQDSIFYKNLGIISKNPKRTEAVYEKVIEQIEKLDLDNQEKEETKSDEVGTKKK